MAGKSEENRTAAIKRALEAARQRADGERLRIPWRSDAYTATVVELSVDDVLLNPRSHRIRAQLESSPERELIESDPNSDEAQEAIAELLQGAEWFKDLQKNLAEAGQLEPGVVTEDGVLVNANTRCVALRLNNARYIRAAVLPTDATQKEIDRLELSLQMKRDFRSDYTFSNELLFIEDLLTTYSYDARDIAVEMGWATRNDPKLSRKAEEVKSYLRVLAMVRELQALSRGRIPIIEFDSNRQALMEIDAEYERNCRSEPAAALEQRTARLVGLLAGAGYRELREIGPDFLSSFLVPAMEDRTQLEPHVDPLTRSIPVGEIDLPGLDLFEDDSPPNSDSARSSQTLLNLLASSVGEETLTLETAEGGERQLLRGMFCAELLEAIEGAAEDVRLDREAGNKLTRPRELVRKATKQTNAAIEAFAEIATHSDFDRQRLQSAVDELLIAANRISEDVRGGRPE